MRLKKEATDGDGRVQHETGPLSKKMSPMPLSISVGEVRRHVAFLERVHDDALNHASALYRNNASILCAAVARCHSETCARRTLRTIKLATRPFTATRRTLDGS